MIQTKYITLDEFNEYFGIDLAHEFDNDVSKADAFLKRIEDRIETYINANFYRNIDIEFTKFTQYQKEHFKRALLEQAIYVFKNGDISVDSGYDPEHGEVASRKTLKNLSIGENCKQELILCGLWCRKIKSNGLWWYY